jgi:hypothetical protein
MQNVNQILSADFLPQLIQPEYFVGWTYAIDYEYAYVMTNDLWKHQALGIPHNGFLTAASFDPRNMSSVVEEEMEVILLRVVESARLPQDDDLVRTKIDFFKEQTDIFEGREIDDITLNELQFGGLKCRVLGTFFVDDDELWLGSDLESYASAMRLNVYRPHSKALETIVNYVDPIRKNAAKEMAGQLGLKGEIDPFRIGTVRYTSTDRLHRRSGRSELVPVYVQPADFLARRTAVLGMTRTGKSNMIKQLVSVVKRIADESGAQIGQIIYDINGEYANANQQDQGALADIYPNDTIRYRMLPAKGFRELRTNFYEQVNEGFGIIQRELEEANRVTTDYVRAFVNLSLDEPDESEVGEYRRWEVRVAVYRTLLYVAGFTPPDNYKVRFTANGKIRQKVNDTAGAILPDPKYGLTLEQAKRWFLALREANEEEKLKSSSGKDWVDDSLQTLLNMIAQRQGKTYISGHRILADAVKYHSPNRTTEVADEIYDLLRDGKIVILDLSVGDARIREKVSTRIAYKIFQASMSFFVEGKTPPNIVVYIEEAHNLIGKGMDLTETWPRLAEIWLKNIIAK